jgi:hypothetical protein
VPLRRDHLYRGRKGNFCISTEVLDGLQAHFSSRAKQMLLDYRARLVGQERGDADGGGQELAGLRLENAMLRSVCSNVARQNVATKSGFNTLVKTQRSSRWLQLRRTITKLRKEKCRPQEFEFPDFNVRKVKEVLNPEFVPSRQVENFFNLIIPLFYKGIYLCKNSF